MATRPGSRASPWVNPRDAVFSPSGAIVRLRRGNKHAQVLAALLTASGARVISESDAQLYERDMAIRRGIADGSIEVI